jgi:hypothetical protein
VFASGNRNGVVNVCGSIQEQYCPRHHVWQWCPVCRLSTRTAQANNTGTATGQNVLILTLLIIIAPLLFHIIAIDY